MKTLLRRLHPLQNTRKQRSVLACRGLAGVAMLCLAGALQAQEPGKVPSAPLTVVEIITMVKSGLTDDVIIAAVKSKGRSFDLNAAEIIELKKSGVSQTVIEYMLDPSKPYAPPIAAPATPPPPAPPLAESAKPPSDPLVAKLPPGAGLYYLTGTQDFSPLDLRPVVPAKQVGKNTKLFGLVKGHIIGSVVGGKAGMRLESGSEATFFLRLGEKGSIDDYALLRLHPAENRRDLDFGTTPGKPVFPFSAHASFESKPAAPGIYRLLVRLADKGEYLFFILGSGDEAKGLLGKGYDFGVDESR
jgi:hypothetical protein